jgi:NTP pyrophosphatase (non-canonical NTP hydrolase)
MAEPKMNKWTPTTNLLELRRLGKLGEELGELANVASRCIIQGLDEVDPGTGKVNRQRLLDEMADVYAQIECTMEAFGLDRTYYAERVVRKVRQMGEWEALFLTAAGGVKAPHAPSTEGHNPIQQLAGDRCQCERCDVDRLAAAGVAPTAEPELSERDKALIERGWKRYSAAAPRCDKAPTGWHCTRSIGHKGPCAAEPDGVEGIDSKTPAPTPAAVAVSHPPIDSGKDASNG